jgi:hypothetical protein
VFETQTFDLPTLVMPALSVAKCATPDARLWHSVVAASLIEAEQLLDQSEREGYHEQTLVVCTPGLFVVRWR